MFEGGLEDTLERRRHYTAEIFRAAARLYLHTVLSGDLPECPEIAEGVRDVVTALRRVPLESHTLARSVMRSVVFPICLAGCMARTLEQNEFLIRALNDERLSVGNGLEVLKVIECVWDARRQGRSVAWRDVVRENGLLLLV